MTNSAVKNIEVSVVIPNFNRVSDLEKCLRSLLRLATDFVYEVIVVDNASTDNSVTMIKDLFPHVIVVEMDRNYLFAKACNEGIRSSRGRYVALLNNDAEVDPDWLQALKDTLDSHANVGSCASRVFFYDQRDTLDSVGDCYMISGSPQKIGHLVKAEGNYLAPKLIFGASASSSIYRRAMLDRIGLLDEDLFFSHEDVDLSFRAQLMGYKCLYVPTAVVYHKVSATIGYLSSNYVYLSQRNIEFVFFKNMPTRLLVKYFLIHAIYNLGVLAFAIKKGRVFAYLRSKLAFMFHFSSIMRKRRAIQRSRTVSDTYIDSILEKKWLSLKLKKALS